MVVSKAVADRLAPLPPRRTCGTMANHMRLLERNPAFHARLFALEDLTAKYRAAARSLTALPVAKIRVVVNVVYSDPSQNITNAQIKSQISALNKDFRSTNPDRTKTPAAFKGLVSDPRIKFVLDRVTRTKTNKTSFLDDDTVKKTTTGGMAPANTAKFLNLWVCALGGGLLGYAQFPGGPAATDGVVIHYRAFGTLGTAQAPYNKGRSATHEIGHYLNLRHIWGDTADCSGSDMVADTPNAAGPNFGKPKFPTVTCHNGPNGDMFMNYMDYVDDDAMFMFTTQQVARMRATLDGPRRSLW
ncbi:MAG TPA: zinc metalloprotease [Vicinamibacterales bacterium]|nr:zinc metalloprotease [Vicinamibacterales bacterium]